MAAAVVPGTSQLKKVQAHKYVALSPTCRSSQLLTPRDLTRITIDDRHYDQYQKCLRANTPRHIYSVPGGDIPSYGDRVAFCCQRDLPVKQFYSNTLLQRSRVRQTDELIPKPTSSNGVIDKEINLPFPAEHPFSSHIKCFSMMPNTSPTVETNSTTKMSSKDISYPIYVKAKASDNWSRLEDMHINARTRHSTGPIWDLPRSHRHQRCYTYPTPKQIYLFGSRQQTGRELRSYTAQGLNRINKLICYETSYQNQFPGYWFQSDNSGVQNVLVLDDSTGNDATNESETKQAHDNENADESEEFAFDSQNEAKKEDQKHDESAEDIKIPDFDSKSEAGQQNTDESNSMDQDLQDMLHLAETAKLPPSKPHVSIDNHYRFYRVDLVPDSQLPGSDQKKIDYTFRNEASDSQPVNQAPFTPRTAVASRRLMSAFEFDKSAVKRRFHAEYPENAPDLRENSSQGRRHFINGHHAYYYH